MRFSGHLNTSISFNECCICWCVYAVMSRLFSVMLDYFFFSFGLLYFFSAVCFVFFFFFGKLSRFNVMLRLMMCDKYGDNANVILCLQLKVNLFTLLNHYYIYSTKKNKQNVKILFWNYYKSEEHKYKQKQKPY